MRLMKEDGSLSSRTAYFVLENERWLHCLSQEELGLFGPDETCEEFVEARDG